MRYIIDLYEKQNQSFQQIHCGRNVGLSPRFHNVTFYFTKPERTGAISASSGLVSNAENGIVFGLWLHKSSEKYSLTNLYVVIDFSNQLI